MHDVSSTFNLHDSRRDLSENREVIAEYGIPEPYVPDEDSWARVPLRLTHNQAAGFVLELGIYDFSDADFDALEHAVREVRAFKDSVKYVDS